jgi:hypothetical protein
MTGLCLANKKFSTRDMAFAVTKQDSQARPASAIFLHPAYLSWLFEPRPRIHTLLIWPVVAAVGQIELMGYVSCAVRMNGVQRPGAPAQLEMLM